MPIPSLKIRNLNAIRNQNGEIKGDLHAEALDDVSKGAGLLGQNMGADPNGAEVVPVAPAGLQIAGQNGALHFAIVDNSAVLRSVKYYIEYDTSPGFPTPRTLPCDAARNAFLALPNGTFYFRVRSQYPHGGGPSGPYIYPQPIVVTNSAFGNFTLPSSQGCGTATGQGAGKSIQR